MLKVNYHILNDSVVLNYNGKTITIAKSDKRYANAIACIKESRWDDIPKAVEVAFAFEGTGLTIKDGRVHDEQGNGLPIELSNRIMQFNDEGLPYAPLFNFWNKLKGNPSFNSRKALFQFLEHNGHPLTDDGCFIAYRGIRDDFKDVHSGKFDNSPGQVLEMPRDQVDDNPNNTCSNGFHVACFDYAKDFGSKLVEVKVNPLDVVTVPVDYNGTKMRVCKFEVIQECEVMRDETLYNRANSDAREDVEEEKTEDELDHCNSDGCDGTSECDDHCQQCGEDRNAFANYCANCGCDL